MANMSQSEYNDYRKSVEYIAHNGSQEELQRLYDEIYRSYDDGVWCIKMLDDYQTRWTMNLHQG